MVEYNFSETNVYICMFAILSEQPLEQEIQNHFAVLSLISFALQLSLTLKLSFNDKKDARSSLLSAFLAKLPNWPVVISQD